jgi:hypothetical protein
VNNNNELSSSGPQPLLKSRTNIRESPISVTGSPYIATNKNLQRCGSESGLSPIASENSCRALAGRPAEGVFVSSQYKAISTTRIGQDPLRQELLAFLLAAYLPINLALFLDQTCSAASIRLGQHFFRPESTFTGRPGSHLSIFRKPDHFAALLSRRWEFDRSIYGWKRWTFGTLSNSCPSAC